MTVKHDIPSGAGDEAFVQYFVVLLLDLIHTEHYMRWFTILGILQILDGQSKTLDTTV